MAPSFEQLKGIAGERFLLLPTHLPPEAISPREKFVAVEAPAPGKSGRVVLRGALSEAEIVVSSAENALWKKADTD
jgi:hypothetical protein